MIVMQGSMQYVMNTGMVTNEGTVKAKYKNRRQRKSLRNETETTRGKLTNKVDTWGEELQHRTMKTRMKCINMKQN